MRVLICDCDIPETRLSRVIAYIDWRLRHQTAILDSTNIINPYASPISGNRASNRIGRHYCARRVVFVFCTSQAICVNNTSMLAKWFVDPQSDTLFKRPFGTLPTRLVVL